MSECVLYRSDCLEVIPRLEAGSVDMVFADLPYQVTRSAWDCMIDIKQFWAAVSGFRSTVILTATQPFASLLISANMKSFRYDLIWRKGKPTGFLHAKKRPLRVHEHVLVFGKGVYNAQMWKADKLPNKQGRKAFAGEQLNHEYAARKASSNMTLDRYPLSLIDIRDQDRSLHPTQKPVALLEWLVKTYTNEGDTVLDPVFGSNTTGVACARLGRNYVGIEKDPEYFHIGTERVNKERAALGLSEAIIHA